MNSETNIITMFKPLQIVISKKTPKEWQRPWKAGESFLFLGEIPNMKGHIAIIDTNGKIHWGYHPTEFRNPTPNEV